MLERLLKYRFEFLLFALIAILFNKVFFSDTGFYRRIVWPGNMILLGIASTAIFKERKTFVKMTKNVFFFLIILIPLAFEWITKLPWLTKVSLWIYIIFYAFIFVEVMRQILQRTESDLSVIFGSICGYLLLMVIAQFTYLLIEYNVPGSFSAIEADGLAAMYAALSYYSMVSMTTVGYGDITPISEPARLLTMFYTIVGQFYMVALVGILVSRYHKS